MRFKHILIGAILSALPLVSLGQATTVDLSRGDRFMDMFITVKPNEVKSTQLILGSKAMQGIIGFFPNPVENVVTAWISTTPNGPALSPNCTKTGSHILINWVQRPPQTGVDMCYLPFDKTLYLNQKMVECKTREPECPIYRAFETSVFLD